VRLFASVFPYDRWGSWEELVEAVRDAEAAGLDAVALPDHVVMPTRPDGPPPPVVWPDPLVLATHLAAHTHRIRLLFHALVIPYRHPVTTAKALATLDVLSGGRVTIVAGTGWLRREFAALGIDFDRRGETTDRALRLMLALWTAPEGRADAALGMPGIVFLPTGLQRPHIPLWIGGSGRRPLRRVLDVGDGWAPMTGTLATLAPTIAELRAAAVEAGRDPTSLAVAHTVRVGPPDPVTASASRHAAADAREPDHVAAPKALPAFAEQAEAAGVTDLGIAFAWRNAEDWMSTVRRCLSALRHQRE
jgi:probable F420-dependent oxidoreductase